MAVSEIILNLIVALAVTTTAIIGIYNFFKKKRDYNEDCQNKLHNLLLERFVKNKLHIPETIFNLFKINFITNKAWNIIVEVKNDNPNLKYQKKYHFTFKKNNIMINNKLFFKLSKEQKFILEKENKTMLYNWICLHFFELIKKDVSKFLKKSTDKEKRIF